MWFVKRKEYPAMNRSSALSSPFSANGGVVCAKRGNGMALGKTLLVAVAATCLAAVADVSKFDSRIAGDGSQAAADMTSLVHSPNGEIAFSVRQPCAGLDIAAFRPGDPVQLAALFDLLCSHNWDPALAAEELAVSKSFLLKQIGRDTAVFARFNEFRVQAGKPPLRL